jgi:hypothetical protein
MSANELQTIWIIIIVLSCASAWTVQEKLFQKIKKLYYQKWIEIGEPGWKTSMSMDTSKFRKVFLTLNYFLKGDSVLDQDIEIRKLKNTTKLVYFLILAVVIIFFITVVIFEPQMI